MPSGSTKPWIEHGTPSRNGITRTRSHRGRKNASAAARSLGSRSQRTKLPPPLKPSRASPTSTVPSGPARSSVASPRAASSSRSTSRYGARSTLAASQIGSASILSSRARNDAGRPPVTGRSSIGSSLVTNGEAYQAPRRPGSNASIAARASPGRCRASRSWVRSSSVTDAAAGGGTSTTSQSPSGGTGPAPRVVDTTRTGQPSSRNHPTYGVAPASTQGPMITGRPAQSSPSRPVTPARTSGSVRSVTVRHPRASGGPSSAASRGV